MKLTSILLGTPTKPSSLISGVTSIILFFLVFIEIALEPFSLKVYNIIIKIDKYILHY